MSRITNDIIASLRKSLQASDRKTSAYDTQATIRRVEGNTAWVHIPGGVDETPVQLTVNAKAGDTVQLRVGGGKAWLTGNATAPPTDDTTATRAVQQITETNVVVETVKKAVAAVAKIAGNTNQYFWHTESGTDTGVHITEIPQDEFLADPENGGGNLLARSNGVAVRDGLAELATFSASGMVVNGCDVFGNPTEIVRLGYGEGTASGGGTNTAPYYTVGIRRSGPGIGNYSLAEGLQVVASGFASHAEGDGTTASGSCSHAEGDGSIASSLDSHAEGDTTTASGGSSHAEGTCSIASGRASHAQNYFTLASSDYQTAIGTCNVEDNANTYALIIGNGTSINDRSNALTVDWSGNVNAAGQVKSKTESYGISLPSGVGASTFELVRNGGIAMLSIINIRSLPAGNTTICTLSSGWRPALDVMHTFNAPAASSSSSDIRVTITTAGALNIYNYGSAITSTSNKSLAFCYVLA